MRSKLGTIKRSLTTYAQKKLTDFTGKSCVLLYHRVADLDDDPELLSVSPQNFKAQVNYLKENYKIFKVGESLRSSGIAITFDDGYQDNATEALPILEGLEAPATFYISSGYIDQSKEFWWDELEKHIFSGKMKRYRFKNLKRSLNSLSDLKELYLDLHTEMIRCRYEEIELILDSLAESSQLGRTSRKTHQVMKSEDVCRISSSDFGVVGAHTQTHTALTNLSQEEQEKEILGSKRDLELLTGKNIVDFSYPFGGRNHFNKDSIKIAKENFETVTTTRPSLVMPWTRSYEIPRFIVRNWNIDDFIKNLKSFGL